MNRIFFNETSLIGRDQNLIIQQKLQLIDYKINRDFTNVYKSNLKDKNIFLRKTLLNNMYSIFYTFSIIKLIDIYQ